MRYKTQRSTNTMLRPFLAAGLTLSFAAAHTLAATFYVAPDGSDASNGSINRPFRTIMAAQARASFGDTVYLRGGTYLLTNADISRVDSVRSYVNDITKDGISYVAYQDELPIFDFRNVLPTETRVVAFLIQADDCVFKGFQVVGVQIPAGQRQSTCFRVLGGDRNRFERLVMRDGHGIGWYLASGSDNLVLHCDAYNNRGIDPISDGNIDGFGAHPDTASDTGNQFFGCRAWFNSDDGFDLISADAAVSIINCWAFYNGFDQDFTSLQDGNGFKAGGYGRNGSSYPDPTPRHQVMFCLAVGNKTGGFYANHHIGGQDWINNTAIRNTRNFDMLSTLPDNLTDVPGYDQYMRNNLSYLGPISNLDQNASDVAYNSFGLNIVVDGSDFLSLDESDLMAPRRPDGGLPIVLFGRLRDNSDLIDRGEDLGFAYNGAAPDLGAFESGEVAVNRTFTLHQLEADADTWVQVEFNIGQPVNEAIRTATHGSDPLLNLRSVDSTAPGAAVREHITYVRFDLSQAEGALLDGGVFEIVATGDSQSWSSSQIHLYGLTTGAGFTPQAWGENSLNWATVGAEAMLALIGNGTVSANEARIDGPFLMNAPASSTIPVVDGVRTIRFTGPEVSEFLAQRKADDGFATFIIVNRPAANRDVRFISREHTNPNWHPRLTLETYVDENVGLDVSVVGPAAAVSQWPGEPAFTGCANPSLAVENESVNAYLGQSFRMQGWHLLDGISLVGQATGAGSYELAIYELGAGQVLTGGSYSPRGVLLTAQFSTPAADAAPMIYALDFSGSGEALVLRPGRNYVLELHRVSGAEFFWARASQPDSIYQLGAFFRGRWAVPGHDAAFAFYGTKLNGGAASQ